MKASNAANDPDGAKPAGKQLESSAPSEANGPGGEPAAHTSLPAGDAAAEDAQADALPISTEIEANQKNKKKQKQKKRQQESNGFAAASQPPSNDQSQSPVKPRKKKHKSGKVLPYSSVSGSVLPFVNTHASGCLLHITRGSQLQHHWPLGQNSFHLTISQPLVYLKTVFWNPCNML